jgi:hypothetical protein
MQAGLHGLVHSIAAGVLQLFCFYCCCWPRGPHCTFTPWLLDDNKHFNVVDMKLCIVVCLTHA